MIQRATEPSTPSASTDYPPSLNQPLSLRTAFVMQVIRIDMDIP